MVELWPCPGHGAHEGKAKDKEWSDPRHLGSQIKDMKIKSLEIYLLSLPIKESGIIDFGPWCIPKG